MSGTLVLVAYERQRSAPLSLFRVTAISLDLEEPAFLAINPNGRVPAIIDRALGCTLWETGVGWILPGIQGRCTQCRTVPTSSTAFRLPTS